MGLQKGLSAKQLVKKLLKEGFNKKQIEKELPFAVNDFFQILKQEKRISLTSNAEKDEKTR